MKICIIYYSGTGNTRLVSVMLKDKLAEKGHKVQLEEIKAEGRIRPERDMFRITVFPDVSGYDGIVFAAPVMAFSLSPVMKKYLPGVSSLQGKKIALLVTKQLPFRFTGGGQALKNMKKICAQKGGEIIEERIVNWGNKDRANMIAGAVEALSNCF